MKSTQFAAHHFSDLDSASFDVRQYSRLKFGDDNAARAFGYELAEKFLQEHSGAILASQGCILIPSPYNFVRNAATIMAKHFMNRLNCLLVEANGIHVEYQTITRRSKYLQDYGKLTKEARAGMLDNDFFYFNKESFGEKIIICLDDCVITATHEKKLIQLFNEAGVKNDKFFVYYTQYTGDRAEIEYELNFSAIQTLEDYVRLSKEPGHQIIVRPLKLLLSQKNQVFKNVLKDLPRNIIEEIYYNCLGEGYYCLPDYQQNFQTLRDNFKNQ